MASTSLQTIGCILGALSWFGMIATCASSEWRKNNFGRTIIDAQIRYEGLWAKCTESTTGQTNCKPYNSFFINLPGVIQICRALMISSIALGLVATILTVLGMKCTSAGNSNPRAKARSAIVGGILHLISGLHVGLASSIYAGCTSSKCFDHLQVTGLQTNYELGPAIISGWILMTSSFWAAILIIMNYNAWSKPTKIIDLSQIRADPRTGQFSDIVSEGATGIYKSKSPVDSGYNSTGHDSKEEVYSTVSYPTSTASSSTYTLRSKLLNFNSFTGRNKPPPYQKTSRSPATFRSPFGIFRNSIGKVTRVTPIATTHI